MGISVVLRSWLNHSWAKTPGQEFLRWDGSYRRGLLRIFVNMGTGLNKNVLKYEQACWKAGPGLCYRKPANWPPTVDQKKGNLEESWSSLCCYWATRSAKWTNSPLIKAICVQKGLGVEYKHTAVCWRVYVSLFGFHMIHLPFPGRKTAAKPSISTFLHP